MVTEPSPPEASALGESAEIRRKKVERFRRHRGIDPKPLSTPDKETAIAVPAKPTSPTKRPSTPPSTPRDSRSVTGRRRFKHGSSDKRDKLVHKLRSAGKERFLSPSSKAEEQVDQLDDSMRSSSERGLDNSIHSVNSIKSFTDGETNIHHVDSKASLVTEDGEANNSNAALEDGSNTNDDVVDATLGGQTGALMDVDSDLSSSTPEKATLEVQRPHRQRRVISQIMARKMEQKAEAQAEVDRIRERKEAVMKAEVDRISQRKAAEARAEAQFMSRAAVKARRQAKAEAGHTLVHQANKRRLAAPTEVEQSTTAQDSIPGENQIDEMQSPTKSNTWDNPVDELHPAKSAVVGLKSTVVEDSADARIASPPKRLLFVDTAQSQKSATGEDEAVNELMGSSKSPSAKVCPRSSIQEEPIEKIQAPVSAHDAASARKSALSIEVPSGELIGSPRSLLVKPSPKSTNNACRPPESAAVENEPVDELMRSPRRSLAKWSPKPITPQKEATVVQVQSPMSLEKATPEEIALGYLASPRSPVAINQPQESSFVEESVDELMGSPRSSLAKPSSEARNAQGNSIFQIQSPWSSTHKSSHEKVEPGNISHRKQLLVDQTQESTTGEESIDELMGSPRSLLASASPNSPLVVDRIQKSATNQEAVDELMGSPRSPLAKPSPKSITHNYRMNEMLSSSSSEKPIAGERTILPPKSPLFEVLSQESSTGEKSVHELMGSPRSPDVKQSPRSTTQERSLGEIQSHARSPEKLVRLDVDVARFISPKIPLAVEQTTESSSTGEEAFDAWTSDQEEEREGPIAQEQLDNKSRAQSSNEKGAKGSTKPVKTQIPAIQNKEHAQVPLFAKADSQNDAEAPAGSTAALALGVGVQKGFREASDALDNHKYPDRPVSASPQKQSERPASENTQIGLPPPPLPSKRRRSRREDKSPIGGSRNKMEGAEDDTTHTSPLPPKKRGSSEEKQGTSAALKLNLRVITQNLSGEMDVEPVQVDTPLPKTLGARRRRRAAANALNSETSQDAPTSEPAPTTEKVGHLADTHQPTISKFSTEAPKIGTPSSSPPLMQATEKENNRVEAQGFGSILNRHPSAQGSEVAENELLSAPTDKQAPTLNITHAALGRTKTDKPFDELSSVAATETISFQLAAAKIVESQLSPPSEIKQGLFEEKDILALIEQKARSSEEESAPGSPDVARIETAAVQLLSCQLSPSSDQKVRALKELSLTEAEYASLKQMTAPQPPGSELSPALEMKPGSFGNLDMPRMASLSNRRADAVDMVRAGLARRDETNSSTAMESLRSPVTRANLASSTEEFVDEVEAYRSLASPNQVADDAPASPERQLVESTEANIPLVKMSETQVLYEDTLGSDESSDQDLRCLVKIAISEAKEAATKSAELPEDTAAAESSNADNSSGLMVEESQMISSSEAETNAVNHSMDHEETENSSAEDEPIVKLNSERETFHFVAPQESNESKLSSGSGASGWDTRSIMEHPLETSPSAVPDIDPSWDASRMTFTPEEKKSQDDVDIFDAVSWSHADSDFSQPTEPVDNTKKNLTRQLVGALASSKQLSVLESEATKSEEIHFAKDVWPSVGESSYSEDTNDTPVPTSLKEDQALLIDDGRNEANIQNDADSEEHLSQKERLDLYNSNKSYISSSDDDNGSTDAESAQEESDEEDEEIKYLSHNFDVDSDAEESSDCEDFSSSAPSEVPAAIFTASDMAAKTANNEKSNHHVGHLGNEAAPSSLLNIEQEAAGVAYPETANRVLFSLLEGAQSSELLNEDKYQTVDPPRSLEAATSRESGRHSKPIPLLAPPPEERLKKWEESKLRPYKHLEAMRLAATETADLHGDFRREKDGGANALFADFSSRVEDPSYFGSVSQSASKVHSDDGEIVSNGYKMVEKAASASSTAAEPLKDIIKAEKKSAICNKDSKDAEDTESDVPMDQIGSLTFCRGAETREENSMPNSTAQTVVDCNPIISNELEPKDKDAVAGQVLGSWTNNSLLGLEGDKLTAVKDEFQMGKTGGDNAATVRSTRDATPQMVAAVTDDDLAVWLRGLVLRSNMEQNTSCVAMTDLRGLLEDDNNFDRLCALVSLKVSTAAISQREKCNDHTSTCGKVREVVPFALANATQRPHVLAANFVSFVQRIGKLAGITSPFKDANPFVVMLVGESIVGKKHRAVNGSMQQLIFDNEGSKAPQMTRFFYDAVQAATRMVAESVKPSVEASKEALHEALQHSEASLQIRRYEIAPKGTPSPFETTTWSLPGAVAMLLGFLGDPVAVCRMKMVNRFCNRIIVENEQTFMRDAVRLGGMSMNVRPAFWMWITLEKSHGNPMQSSLTDSLDCEDVYPVPSRISKLAQLGREGKWHSVIERDVARAFGNMPPHKTGARFRADSIVRALVTYGRGRLIKRGVRGGGEAPPISRLPAPDGLLPKSKAGSTRSSTAAPQWLAGDAMSDGSDVSETPTDTVSDWGCVSPVASFASSVGEEAEIKRQSSRRDAVVAEPQVSIHEGEQMDVPRDPVEELALGGNTLTNEMKAKLQNQLEFILHALAAEHGDVGYCQGMDYVVAHLLRVLQDTVKWQATRGCLPSVIAGADKLASTLTANSTVVSNEAIAESLVVEEAVFRVMDCFFTTYSLRHMYWPELRSLKICCRVFERLIQHKLPVLADHFEHQELNVGLFALGWFQTLYLYLPSMPAATVCHMWDIWLVERSFKIFFRVGTAILFLSQPILLNHDLEGMMTYLNTFPDATLLKPDILIACALQIKVTNRMLAELEMEVTGRL